MIAIALLLFSKEFLQSRLEKIRWYPKVPFPMELIVVHTCTLYNFIIHLCILTRNIFQYKEITLVNTLFIGCNWNSVELFFRSKDKRSNNCWHDSSRVYNHVVNLICYKYQLTNLDKTNLFCLTRMPVPIIPNVYFFRSVIVEAILLAILSFSLSISLATIFASKQGYSIDSNQVSFPLIIIHF